MNEEKSTCKNGGNEMREEKRFGKQLHVITVKLGRLYSLRYVMI